MMLTEGGKKFLVTIGVGICLYYLFGPIGVAGFGLFLCLRKAKNMKNE